LKSVLQTVFAIVSIACGSSAVAQNSDADAQTKALANANNPLANIVAFNI
jgi:hypothetical protein